MIDFSELLTGCISSADGALKKLDGEWALLRTLADCNRLEFLNNQLAHIVRQLTVMLVDLESGKSLADLEFACEEDFIEMVEMCQLQITNLKAQMRALQVSR